MTGQNVIRLDQSRRVRSPFLDYGTIAMLIFLIFDAMILTGMVGGFVLTRAAADSAWPPAGQPWFPLAETAFNSAALLVGGWLIFRAGRRWEQRELSIAPPLLAAIALGTCFVFAQGLLWVDLIRQGLTLGSSQHGTLFCLVVATHAAHVVGAVISLGRPGCGSSFTNAKEQMMQSRKRHTSSPSPTRSRILSSDAMAQT